MFRFRLQRVLELREDAEQAASLALVSARDAADEARRVQEELTALHRASKDEISETQRRDPRIGHLQQLGLLLESIEERIDGANEATLVADAVVNEKQSALDLAARDRRVLDRLKDRHMLAWRATESQKDRLAMDEVALARFGRKQDSANDGQAPHTAGENADSEHSTSRTDGSLR